MAAALLPWVKPQFCDAAGDPVASGKLYSFVAGTDTPQPTYSDVDLTIANANPTLLNAAGQSATSIYLLPTGYKVRLDTAAGVPLWTVDDVADVGAVFAAGLGRALTAGAKAVTSGYTTVATDRLVTVASSGGPDPCVINLLPAATATQPLCVKNTGDTPCAVTPNGSDALDGATEAYTLPGATDTTQPAIWLAPDGVGAWYILASHLADPGAPGAPPVTTPPGSLVWAWVDRGGAAVVAPGSPGGAPTTLDGWRDYVFGLLDETVGQPADDYEAKLQALADDGMLVNASPGEVPSVSSPFFGIWIIIDGSGHPRGRIQLPTATPDANGYYTHEFQVIAAA
jgi:hypothetical protein